METRLASLALITALAAGCQTAPAGVERGAQVFDYCVQCHGADGAGNPDIEAPAIAGLPAWYVEAQIHKFRDGTRGAHPDDLPGLRMRPMSRTGRVRRQPAEGGARRRQRHGRPRRRR